MEINSFQNAVFLFCSNYAIVWFLEHVMAIHSVCVYDDGRHGCLNNTPAGQFEKREEEGGGGGAARGVLG